MKTPKKKKKRRKEEEEGERKTNELQLESQRYYPWIEDH